MKINLPDSSSYLIIFFILYFRCGFLLIYVLIIQKLFNYYNISLAQQ